MIRIRVLTQDGPKNVGILFMVLIQKRSIWQTGMVNETSNKVVGCKQKQFQISLN